ncbi:patatin-like phospholipase family protein [Vibrio tapetis]|uniref:patatin-like phospholipase family protein n=1 Tax=Vibrio tapetis TaxID=52443 RepID=UPI0026C502E8
MKWIARIGVVMMGSLLSLSAFSEPIQTEKQVANNISSASQDRPTIALVLAGGGAKGAAHIGVLKALEELHIPIDIVTGTSMGAFVGGLYATGMSADEIESLIDTVDWNSGYRDRVARSDKSIRDKDMNDHYQINTDLGIRGFEFTAPKGVVQGQNMLGLLRESAGNLPPMSSFDDLAVRYRAVATDIVKLEPVVLEKGYLIDAMMASMSVPGALPPYKVGDRLLVDGGVTNNMPVELAREMGADLIIAVDISTDYKKEDELKSFLTVGDQLSNYMVRRSTEKQSDLLTDDDVLLTPLVGDMETTEFDRMIEAYEVGYVSAMQSKKQLEDFVVTSAQFQRYIDHKQQARVKLEYGDELVVDTIQINNGSRYRDSLIKSYLALETGERLSMEEIERRIDALYALDRFETISYRYEKDQDQTTLVIDVNEKEWGPNFIDFRFFLEDDFQTRSQYGFGVSTNFTALNSRGGEFLLNLEMGSDKLIEGEFFTPLIIDRDIFSSTIASYSNTVRNFPWSSANDGNGLAGSIDDSQNYIPMTYRQYKIESSLGANFSAMQELRAGVRYVNGNLQVTSLPYAGSGDFTRLGAFARYRYDSLDDLNFPTRGSYINLEYFNSQDTVNEGEVIDSSKDTVHEVVSKFVSANSYKRHSLVGQLEYEVVHSQSSSLPIEPRNLGGFLNLSGIPRNSLIGQNKLFSSMVYRYRWFDNDFGLFKSPLYLGASVEYGGVWSGEDVQLEDAPIYLAGSLFAGVASPVGPIVLAWGHAEHGYNSIYLIVGSSF